MHPVSIRLADFNTFNEPDLIEAKRQAIWFVRRMKQSPNCSGYCLSLLGNSGNGKTTLAKGIWKIVAPYGGLAWARCGEGYYQPLTRSCLWFDWREIASSLYSGDFSMISDLKAAWFLVLDDIGAHNDKAKLAAGTLDEVLRSRRDKWTVITGNLLLKDLQSLDTRIASFLIRDNNRTVHIKAVDYALRKKI